MPRILPDACRSPLVPLLAAMAFAMHFPVREVLGDPRAPGKPSPYSVTILPLLPGFTNSRAYGLNSKGQVVGQVARLEPKLETRAVLWDQGTVREFPVPREQNVPPRFRSTTKAR